jgi:hypothetical protein
MGGNYNDYSNYSYIDNDKGYIVMDRYKYIDNIIPFKPTIEPRLIHFLRTLFYYKQYNIQHCVPLYDEFSIDAYDWIAIKRYIHRYNIYVFYFDK